jgi:hypothetical protein
VNVRIRSETRVTGLVAGACLFVATAMYLALQLHIGVPAAPHSASPADLFAWWRPLQWLTTTVHLLAASALVAIAVLGIQLSRVGDRAVAGIGLGGALLTSGGIVTAVAQLVQMGGNRAVLDSSRTTMNPDVLSTIGYTTDSIAQAVGVVGYASLGLGVLTISLASVGATDRFGRLLGVVFGVALLALALFNLTDPLALVDPVTGLAGLVLAPAWLWRVVAAPARGVDEADGRAQASTGARAA